MTKRYCISPRPAPSSASTMATSAEQAFAAMVADARGEVGRRASARWPTGSSRRWTFGVTTIVNRTRRHGRARRNRLPPSATSLLFGSHADNEGPTAST